MQQLEMTAIRFPKPLKDELDNFAKVTGRTRTQVVLDAIKLVLKDRPERADEAKAPVFSSLETMHSEN